jgi:hypothetical protein
MNPYTGEVRSINLNESVPPAFEPVPKYLKSEAHEHIRNRTRVDLKGKSGLAEFARAKRKEQRKARKANRHK